MTTDGQRVVELPTRSFVSALKIIVINFPVASIRFVGVVVVVVVTDFKLIVTITSVDLVGGK